MRFGLVAEDVLTHRDFSLGVEADVEHIEKRCGAEQSHAPAY